MKKLLHKKIVVIYHGGCWDGFSGAWAAWKKFGNRAEYIGATDRLTPPSDLARKEVYFIDWTYPLKTTLRLKRSVKKLVIIDHHITGKNAVVSADDYLYDITHSGAVLAWKYFHPAKAAPRLLRNIEDYDLWKFKFPNTKEITLFLETVPQNFEGWSRAVSLVEKSKSRRKVVELGRILRSYQKALIAETAANARSVLFEGEKVMAVNTQLFHDELGHYLANKKPPFAIMWRERRDGGIRVSLRSVRGFDVERISRKYGGGGHRASAGFTLSARSKVPWRSVK